MTTTVDSEAEYDEPEQSPPYEDPGDPDDTSGDETSGDGRDERRGRIALTSVTALAFVLNAWGIGEQGLGNAFYAAAARSMSSSWHNWFFNSFDPGGYITVDKPPVATWIQALSVRVFGFSSTSLMLPSAIAGAAAVAILWCTIRPRFGIAAATVSAGILALSPINVAVNRLNLPDPFMILFLVAAAWAVMRSFDSRHGLRWVVLAGLFVGVAFNTKMLAAYIPVPAIGLAVLIGTSGSWWRRIGRGVAFGVSTIVCSLPWLVVVDLWSKSARPYIGGSTNNTAWDLVFGYNGFGRVQGNGQTGGAQVGGGGLGGPGGVFGGSPGLFRLWDDAVGGQIAWLIPLGVAAAVGALWLHRRDRGRMAAVVMFALWALICGVVFSYAKGTFHSYYTSELAPGLAATIGIGGVALVKLIRTNRAWLGRVGHALGVTVVVQIDLIGRTPDFFGWTEGLLILLAVAAGVVLIVSIFSEHRRVLIAVGLSLALAASVITPAAWALSETSNATLNATLPQAGPRSGTAAGTFGGGQFAGSQNTSLATFLRAENNGEKWDLVVSSAMSASDLIANDDISVMALGGFLGSDPVSTVQSIADLVDKGEVRFFQPSGGGFGGFGAGGFRPNFNPGTGGTGGTGNFTPPNSNPGTGGTGGRPTFTPGSGNLPQFPNGGRPQGGFGGGGGIGGFGGVANDNSAILSAVGSACTAVTSASTNGKLPSAYDGQIYDCQGKGAALRATATT